MLRILLTLNKHLAATPLILKAVSFHPVAVIQISGRRAQHCSSKPKMEACTGAQKCNNIITQITAVFRPKQQLITQSSLAFPLIPFHPLPMLYLQAAVAQVWSHGALIPFNKRAENYLGKKAKPLVGSERQISSPCKQMSDTAKEGGRGISLFHFSEL